MSEYNFVPFREIHRSHNKSPSRMDVGEIVTRIKRSKTTVNNLMWAIGKAEKNGMSFSVCETEKEFTIRRDK